MKDIPSYICLNNKVSIVRGADCAAAVTAACCCSQLLHADQTPPPSPPAAALQDRKTRAAENQHQRRGTGDWCGDTHSAAAGFTLPPPCSISGSRCGHWLAAVHQLPQSLAQGFRRERTRRPPATGLRGHASAAPILFIKQ